MQYKVFGCKVNKFYTDKWLNSDKLEEKKGIFIASCVVTDKAKRKWIKFVKDSSKKLEKDEKIFISGCGAFEGGKEDNDFFKKYKELEELRDKIIILGEDPDEHKEKNEKKLDLSKKISSITKKLKQSITTKKFLLIQGGCDSYCTFCLTVQKRGGHFYRSKEEIVNEILDFENCGGKEVVLTGVNLAAWGLESTNDIGKSKFAELLNYILENTKIERIRISSMGPEFINDDVLKIFENKRIYPHFHYSIQSGSSKILKAMARHYDAEYMEKLLEKTNNINREDGVKVSIGADIIVGFPGETESDFLETLFMINDYQITKLHAFPFSSHKYGDTVPASFFKDQIDEKTKRDRFKKIENIGEKVRKDFINSQIGKEFKVLIENISGDNFEGWTQNYIEVNKDNFEILEGKVEKNEIIIGILKKLP